MKKIPIAALTLAMIFLAGCTSSSKEAPPISTPTLPAKWVTPTIKWADSLKPAPFVSGASSVLGAGEELSIGQSMVAPNQHFTFTFQDNGNLVLYYRNTLLWESQTTGTGANQLLVQSDGNLVLLNPQQASVWESHTAGEGVSTLTLQDNGDLVLSTLWSQKTTWSSGTPIETYVNRAKVWVDSNVTYDQYATANPDGTKAAELSGYRTDCSGFISMAWGLPAEGLRVPNTVRLAGYSRLLDSKDELVPGDAINNRQPGNKGHVLMFVEWINKSEGTLVAYEELCGWDGTKCAIGKAVQTYRTLVWINSSNGWGIAEYSSYEPWYLERKTPIPALRLIY